MITAAIWLLALVWKANADRADSRLLQYAMVFTAAALLTIAVNQP